MVTGKAVFVYVFLYGFQVAGVRYIGQELQIFAFVGDDETSFGFAPNVQVEEGSFDLVVEV